MRIAIIGFTRRGCALAARLATACTLAEDEARAFGPARFADEVGVEVSASLDAWTAEAFRTCDAVIFVSACGIAVRAVSPFVRDKMTDPAVVCIDEAGHHAIALLSGHVGGANALARRVARICGGQAVISTATDANDVFAVDEWAARQGLAILERDLAKAVSSLLLEGGAVGFTSEYTVGGTMPEGLVSVAGVEPVSTRIVRAGKGCGPAMGTPSEVRPSMAETVDAKPQLGICVSLDTDKQPFAQTLHLVPRTITVGIGCKRGTSAEAIAQLVEQCLGEAHVTPWAVRAVASIDVKADEEGLLSFARVRGWQLRVHTAEELAAVPGSFHSSAFVQQTVGVDNVCERAACACGERLLLPRRNSQGVTVALAAHEVRFSFGEETGASVRDSVQGAKAPASNVAAVSAAPESEPVLDGAAGSSEDSKPALDCLDTCDSAHMSASSPGILTCVGLGPGAGDTMTLQAREALDQADVIVGYRTYINLIRDAYPHKELLATGMRGEIERCQLALQRAAQGQRVAMICSGDPGVYGMAGLLLELAEDYPSVQIDVVPGVTAANGGAAVLGAPLMHDWCSISLSDLMTPWGAIEARLRAAAQADFCIVLYNPSSHGRADHLRRACDILLQHRSPQTVCGLVRNIGRDGEECKLLTLVQLREAPADMLTCVFVGNSQTRAINGRMVTPRGYQRGDG